MRRRPILVPLVVVAGPVAAVLLAATVSVISAQCPLAAGDELAAVASPGAGPGADGQQTATDSDPVSNPTGDCCPATADSSATGGGAGVQLVSGANWAAQIDHLYPMNGATKLPPEVISALAESAGRTVGVEVPGDTMEQVTLGESAGEPGAHGFDPNGVTQGFGLWQVTTAFNDDLVPPLGGYPAMLNPIKNAIVMAEIYKRQGIGAWYGTRYVTDWDEHYTGSLPLVNLYTVLGLPSSGPERFVSGSAAGSVAESVAGSATGSVAESPAGSGAGDPTESDDCAAGPSTLITGPTTAGSQSQILSDGLATIPQDAPVAVQRAIAAGNRIIHTFYSQERRPGMLEQVQDSYDCSGSSDFILYQAGLSDPTVDVGDGIAGTGITIENYEQPGWGKWITVFGSSEHEFIKVDNIVMDTAWYAPVVPTSVPDPYPADDPTNGGPASGPRWQPESIIPQQLGDGNAWVPRHPNGL